MCTITHTHTRTRLDLKAIKDSEDILDPSRPGCLAYKPMPREELCNAVWGEHRKDHKALRKNGGKGIFSDAFLALFYHNLNRVARGEPPVQKIE